MSEASKFSPFSDWKRELLIQRELSRPDGRALYLYRLTDDEFNALERLLREASSRLELTKIARLPGFSDLFVLYASEWWRRRYDGSGFAWEPILRALGTDPEQWKPGERSECVRLGLRAWDLQLLASGGLRFLGTVAVQGGLPLRMLAEARGGIGQVLRRVLQLSSNGHVSQPDLQSWVASLQNLLPGTYRQEAIFILLADVAWIALQLKREAGLTTGADAIAILDQQIPGWRERFPLPIGDAHARGLIEQFVRDAASVRVEKQSLCLPLERALESDPKWGWMLRSMLSLPDSIPATQLAKLFGIAEEDMPRAAELSVTAGGQCLETRLRRIAGHNAYRVERKPWEFAGEKAAGEHVLRLAAPDGRVWSATTAKGEALDDELPWVFEAEDASCSLLRQGGGSVAAHSIILALPAGWHLQPQAEMDAVAQGQLTTPVRQLWRVQGTVEIHSGGGLNCRLRTGQAGATDGNYEWHGHRVWLDFQQPTMAFRGLPELYRLGEDGTSQRTDTKPGWSLNGAPSTTPLIGPVVGRYPAIGEIKHRSRLLVLPPNAALALEFRDAQSGTLRLSGWGASNAAALTDGVNSACQVQDDDLTLDLSMPPGARAPDHVEIRVLWPHTTAPARFRVPFPAQGVRAFDGAGRELRTGDLLALQQLIGSRLRVLAGGENAEVALEFSANHGRALRTHRLRMLPGAVNLEIRLQDHSTDLHHLLATDGSPDARVQVVVRIAGRADFNLNIGRYAALLEQDAARVYLDHTGLQALNPPQQAALPVLAIRLEHPGDEPIVLPACRSEGVANGAWLFEPREPGCWLIYPGPDAALPFRPTVWPVVGDAGGVSLLALAVGVTDPRARAADLDDVIAMMVADPHDDSWLEIEQLVGQTGHLPLVTLDVWGRFARSPEAMATLALRSCNLPVGWLDRFAQEFPFAWEAVPYAAWRQAIVCLQKQCVGSFGDDDGASIFRSHLDFRIKDLTAGHGGLAYMLGIASADFSPQASRQAQVLRATGSQSTHILFESEDSLLQKLLRGHGEESWPPEFAPILRQTRNQTQVDRYLSPKKFGFHDGVINAPLLLAAQAAANQTQNWFAEPANIDALRTIRAFDPDWFDDAYNQTIARCLADGLLDCG